MTFYDPQVLNINSPVLPEARFEEGTLVYAAPPTINTVTHSKSSVAEGFFAECSMGGNVFNVQCSSSGVDLEAHVTDLGSLSDDYEVQNGETIY